MTTEIGLQRAAREIAEQAQSLVFGLESEVLDLETKLAQKKAERDAARRAPQRLTNFAVKIRADSNTARETLRCA
jgi:hypothetical protein